MGVYLLVVLVLVLGARPAGAVIGGQPVAVREAATLELRIWHSDWRGGAPAPGTCSAVIVGVHPLTLLTASHCFQNPALDPATGLPLLELLHLPEAASYHLAKAFFRPMAEVKREGTNDVAALVFDRPAAFPVRPVEISTRPYEAGPLFLCGFGFSAAEAAPEEALCASRRAVGDPDDFTQFLPDAYRAQDPLLYSQFEAQFRSKAEYFASRGALIAVNRLEAGAYSLNTPMPRVGDSGGPWFRHGSAERPAELLALTSIIETFYRSNLTWPAFGDRRVPKADLPYAAFGVRLDLPAVQEFLRAARAQGADLSFAP